MTREEFKNAVMECGDAVITYRSTNSRKLKYNVCTLDFSTPYIQKKRNRARPTKDTVAHHPAVFFTQSGTPSLDFNSLDDVTSIIPLSKILRNERFNKW